MEFSAQEKSYIWLDSFPLEESEKRKLLAIAVSPVALVKGLENFKDMFVDFKKQDVFQKMLCSLKDNGEYFSSVVNDLNQKGITPIAYSSNDYPSEWKRFPDAPLVLYAKGDSSLLKNELFCVVGSRRTQQTALKTGEKIAQILSQDFTILTGVADGGDTAAIEGALKGTGKVVCLLAGGFSSIPKGNYPLLKKVAERGLLLSPHSFDSPTLAYSYEQRNKLLAGLCCGLLVLGAGEKSGALITARYAKEFQKPVFALPYPPLSGSGVGCNALIKRGAALTESADDVLSFYGREIKQTSAVELTDSERAAVEFLTNAGEAHLSEIATAAGLPLYKLSAVMSALEMKGLVVRLGSNRYALV